MKTTIKLMAIACLFLSFNACQVEDDIELLDESISLKNAERSKMVSFETMKDFKNAMEVFNTFTDISEYENWSNKYGHQIAFNSEDVSIKDKGDMPYRFLFILNENKQFMIGDNVITYNDNFFYSNPINTYDKVALKNQEIIGSVETTEVEKNLTDLNTTNSKASNPSNVGTGNNNEIKDWANTTFYRRKYASKCNLPQNKGLTYRLVHYVVNKKVTIGGSTYLDLYFRLRMSHRKSSGSWVYNNESTERKYEIDLHGSCVLIHKNSGIQVAGTNRAINIDEKNTDDCNNTLKGLLILPPMSSHSQASSYTANLVWAIDFTNNSRVLHWVNGDGDHNKMDRTIDFW